MYINNINKKRTRKKNILQNVMIKISIAVLFICVGFIIFIYSFEKAVMPTVLAAADAEIRTRSVEIVNTAIINQYTKQFNYDDIIRIEKDQFGNIVMLKADTLKMSKIACDVVLETQDKLQKIGNIGISMPLGYIFNNNLLAYYGPSITVKMQPAGYIETKYLSEFESAGINQTRHKIYVQLKTNVRVVIPLLSNNIEIENEVPIAETIVVGKVPDSAINFDLNSAGFKLNNSDLKNKNPAR
jgi:sporulation protein YunB